MFISENLSVNENGNLAIADVDCIQLAKEYGTPLYVMDEQLIRKNCQRFKDSVDKHYSGNGMVCYASKAFSCLEIYRIIQSEGLGTDVVSIGELYCALKAGFDSKNICFHGNNKTDEELEYAVDNKVGRIIVDNIPELNRLNEIAAEKNVSANIMFRIKPGIEAHTHEFVKTGKIDSKFGFALETGEAFEAIKFALENKHVNLKGIHCHIGSQIFDIIPFEAAAEVLLKFIAKIKKELGCEIDELNLGGGFGIMYTEKDSPVPYENFMERGSKTVHTCCRELEIKQPFIIIEPGRAITGSAGITLYTVGSRKEIPNIRTYISVDGGMCDNPRYLIYKSEYDAVVANKANVSRDEVVTIAGKCCESGDLIGEGMSLQHAESGDIIAVCATGAYNYSMSSNYNKTRKPAVVFVNNKESRVAVKRESLDDLIRNDI